MVVWVLTEARYAFPSSEAPSLPPYVQNVLNEDFALVEALRACGLEADRKVWSDPSVDWGAADALVFRTTWDYFDRWEAFQGWLHDVEKVTTLINPAACLHWNLDKHYLLDLQTRASLWCPASSTAATKPCLGTKPAKGSRRTTW